MEGGGGRGGGKRKANKDKGKGKNVEKMENLEGAGGEKGRKVGCVWVKGCRFMKMERVIEALEATATSKEDIPCC